MCLEEIMAGKKTAEQHIIVEPEYIMTRRSTDILAIKDPNIITAIQFIKANCKKFIQVDEVAEAVGINRRSLERYFKKYLNRTIHQEIKRTRVEMISELITETDLSIGEIAAHMGFSNINHISRYFKESKGINPRELR
jgi:LacI family transcriptional regulator